MKFEVGKLYIDRHSRITECILIDDDQAVLKVTESKCMYVTDCREAYQYLEYKKPQTIEFSILFLKRSDSNHWYRYSSYVSQVDAEAVGNRLVHAERSRCIHSDYIVKTYEETLENV